MKRRRSRSASSSPAESPTNISFKDRVVIVTGAGGGLGRSYALDIARRGGAVVVNDLGGAVEGGEGTKTMADGTVEEIIAKGGRAVANYDSVTTDWGAMALVDCALQAFGRVDALINNAGNFRNAPFEESTVDDLDALIQVHLRGSFLVSQAVWPIMKRQQSGRIVFTASSAGVLGYALHSCYGAAKAGVIGLMNVLSHEGAAHGILCNAIMPNGLSRMTAKASAGMDPAHVERAKAMLQVLGNSMNPEFNAGLAVYLASEACKTTHGIYSSCVGRIARVFVGVGKGWQGSRSIAPSAEDVAENFSTIDSYEQGFDVPLSPNDEMRGVLSASKP